MNATIYINGRFLFTPVTGVQRYALEILRQFDRLLQEPEGLGIRMVCLVPALGPLPQPGWKNIELRGVGARRGNLWEQLDLPHYARGGLLFSPCNSGPLWFANQVITFHDAAVFGIPAAYSAAFRLKYALSFHILARRARLILTDSVFSQGQLAHYLRLPRERFRVILLGGDHLAGIQPDPSILARHDLPRRGYFLSVASQSAHKNFGLVLQAAGLLGGSALFATAGGSFRGVFQRSGSGALPGNVRALGYVSDAELVALYENALGFIFPSLYEGFGLPVLEAMNCGCPVICSDAASLPEVGGDAVAYFDPRDAATLVEALQRLLRDPAVAENLRSAGRQQAAGFTWENAARATLRQLLACLPA